MENKTRLRRDTARTRDRLLDAAGELLAEHGTGFSLPDLARASGVGTATVYRHFDDVRDVHREFYYRLVAQLVAEL
jgi:AcrR family transcriptional regulator